MRGHSGRHFLQIPGPTNVPDRVLRALSRADDRPPRPGVRRARRATCSSGCRAVFAHVGPGRHLPVVGHRARGRRRSSTRSRPATACSRSRPATSPRSGATLAERLGLVGRVRPRRLAPRRRPGRRRASGSPPTARARDQGRVRRPQRDLDRRHEPRRRGARGHGRGGPPRAAARRHHLLARLDRLPPRRVGRRRHDRLLAEGADAAARPRASTRSATKALDASRDARGCRASYWDWAPILEANARGGCSRTRRRRTCSTACARRSTCCSTRGWRTSSPATRATPRRRARPCARGGSSSSPLDDREHSASLTAVLLPGRARRRRACAALILDRYDMSLGAGLGQARRQGLPHRPPRRLQRLWLAGTLAGVEMGLVGAGVPVRPGRRAGGARPPRGDGAASVAAAGAAA